MNEIEVEGRIISLSALIEAMVTQMDVKEMSDFIMELDNEMCSWSLMMLLKPHFDEQYSEYLKDLSDNA